MYQNIADTEVSASAAASSIVSQIQAWGRGAIEPIHIIDAYNEVANNFAVGTNDLSQALEISAAGMATYGNTFEENALIKAKTIHNYLNDKNLDYLVMADDSGLCCDSLDGAPGIYSARYAEEHNDQANRDKLIKDLEGKDKSAYFNCTIVLYYPNDEYKVFVGKTYGIIIEEEKGKTDFGYDPIFYSNDLNKTFGEASEEEKNRVSHRGRAINEMLKEL